jgi:hypothetical protein
MTRHIVSSFLLCMVGSCLAYGQGTVSGTQYHIGQFTTPAGTTIGNTNSVTDPTGNNLTVPGLLTGKQTNGQTNSDLAGGVTTAIAACAPGVFCNILRPYNSTDTAAMWQIANAANGLAYQLKDYDGILWSVNAQPYGHQCENGEIGTAGTGNPGALVVCDTDNGIKVGGGVDLNNNWTSTQHHSGLEHFNTRGQAYHTGRSVWYEKMYDSIDTDINGFFRGGCDGGSCEGDKFDAMHWIQQTPEYGVLGTAGNGTHRGLTAIQLNFGAENNSYVMDGGHLLFSDEHMDTTTFPSCAAATSTLPELCQTSTTHAVSTWQGTLVGACGVLNIRDAKGGIGSVSIGATPGTGYVAGDIVTVVNGFASGGKVLISAVSAGVPTTISVVSASPGFDYSIANNLTTTGGTGTGFTVNVLTITGQATCTVNVAVSTAAPTVGQSVTIADNTATEQARIVGTAPTTGVTGNVNVTLLMTLPHQAGSPVMFGGTAGGFAVFGGGLADPTTAPYTIALGSMPIGGAPDATHEYVVINYNQGPANGIIFPPATTSSIGTISCSAGAVTFPAGTVGGDLNVTPVGIQQYVVSGNSSSAMNGAVTGVV